MGYASPLLKFLTSALSVLPIYAHGGEPLGLMDSDGREILAAKYSEVHFLGNGLYLTRSMAPGLAPGCKYSLFNRDGKELEVRVPAGAEFIGVYSLGPSRMTNEKTSFFPALPDKALVIFSRQGKFGLCDSAGKEVLPARFGAIDTTNGGTSLVFENRVRYFPSRSIAKQSNECPDEPTKPTDRAFIFKAESHSLKPIAQKGIYSIASGYSDGLRSFSCVGEPKLAGYLDASGRVAIEPQFQGAGNFQDGQALITKFGKESYPGANLRVIDKSGTIVPTGNLVLGRRWNGFYLASELKKDKGVVNRDFEWVLPPAFSLVLAKTDGSYFTSKLSDKKVSVYSNTGKELSTMSFDDLDRTRMYYRCLPKSEYKCSIGKQAEAGILSTQYAFDEPSVIGISSNGLVSSFRPYPQIGWDGQLNRPISSTLAAQLYPRIVEAQTEPDRFVMSNARGTFNFDSIRWKELQGSSGFPPLPPTSSLLPGYYGDALDLFSRFLHEYNLIGMSRPEVLDLLGPGTPYSKTVRPSLRYMILCGGCCGDKYVFVDINFENESVCDWRFSGSDNNKSSPFLDNVILVPEIGTVDSLTNMDLPRANQDYSVQSR